jgi:hypothetical protein
MLVKTQVLAEQLAAAQSDILGEPIDFAFVQRAPSTWLLAGLQIGSRAGSRTG